MTDRDHHEVAVLDTSVLIDLDRLDESRLPEQGAITAVTLAELSAGLHTTNDPIERAARLTRLQVIESSFDPLSFDATAARQYGHLVARVIAAGLRQKSAIDIRTGGLLRPSRWRRLIGCLRVR